jgi:hypothetical protein
MAEVGEKKRVVARRPEPPRDESPRPKLTQEEIRALLAVEAPRRPDWGRVARRGGLGLIPTAILGVLLDSLIGWWATPVLVAVLVVWAAWPLFRQSRDGWT